MFSFVGDTILDPFMGTGTTNLAAAVSGRNSVGLDIDPEYLAFADARLRKETFRLFLPAEIDLDAGLSKGS